MADNTYKVIRKADGRQIYEYQAEAPIEWAGMAFAEHDHVLQVPQAPAQESYTGSWLITPFAFRARFTHEEKVAVEIAALDDPAAPMQSRAQAAALRASQADLAAATYIDLQRPDVRAAVQQLEAAGLIGAGRAAVILDTPPAKQELYGG